MDTPAGRVRAGCIPISFDGTSILMVTSKSNSSYFVVPKGGVEEGESLLEAALRETFEEAGITGHVRCGPFEINEVSWFEMIVTQEFPEWPESRKRQRKWFKVKDLLDGQALIGDRFREVLEHINDKYSQ